MALAHGLPYLAQIITKKPGKVKDIRYPIIRGWRLWLQELSRSSRATLQRGTARRIFAVFPPLFPCRPLSDRTTRPSTQSRMMRELIAEAVPIPRAGASPSTFPPAPRSRHLEIHGRADSPFVEVSARSAMLSGRNCRDAGELREYWIGEVPLTDCQLVS